MKNLGEIEIELIIEALMLKMSVTITPEGKASLFELVGKMREMQRKKGLHV